MELDIAPFRVTDGSGFTLAGRDPRESAGWKKGKTARRALEDHLEQLAEYQEVLYAHNRYGVLVVLQAMDAAGKDGLIRHVMTGLNPQGVQVRPFKQPSAEELDHDYLWRAHAHLPARGNMAIFNRSYYEDVVVVRLHDLLEEQNLPEAHRHDDVWQLRHRQIRDFERYMEENGIAVVKIFLHLSYEEQRERLLKRIDRPDKHWKFSSADIEERQHWDRYQEIYEEVIAATATSRAPWYIVPADRKWFARLLTSRILLETLQALPIRYPELDPEQEAMLGTCRAMLLDQDDTEDHKED